MGREEDLRLILGCTLACQPPTAATGFGGCSNRSTQRVHALAVRWLAQVAVKAPSTMSPLATARMRLGSASRAATRNALCCANLFDGTTRPALPSDRTSVFASAGTSCE